MSNELAILKVDELNLRKSIFKILFPNPREGVNTYPIDNMYAVKGEYKMSRKIDIAALNSGRDTFEAEDIDASKLVKYKPELSMTEYNKLTDKQKHIFDFCLVATEAAPSMEIVEIKK